ncbi:MAG: hypothetical protein ACFFD1_02835 [Candidatus Thorarchaeota archaeon]
MDFTRKSIIVFSFMIILLCFTSAVTVNNATLSSFVNTNENSEYKAIVMFHEGRNQNVNSTLMNGALQTLKDEGYYVIVSSDPINASLLAGIDVLIIPGSPINPTNTQNPNRYSDQEIQSMKSWLLQPKHGLVLLSNPYLSNSTLDIDSSSLNLIVSGISLFPANRFSTGTNTLGVTINTIKPTLSSDSSLLSFPLVNSSEFSFKGNESIITRSNNVQVLYPMVSVGLNSYAITSDNSYDLGTETPVILGGSTSTQTTSRLFLIGSALMFSDLPGPVQSSSEPVSWFETANNKDAWIEAIRWTASIENTIPSSPNQSTLELLVSSQLLIGSVLILAGIILSFGNRNSKEDLNPSLTKINDETSKKESK